MHIFECIHSHASQICIKHAVVGILGLVSQSVSCHQYFRPAQSSRFIGSSQMALRTDKSVLHHIQMMPDTCQKQKKIKQVLSKSHSHRPHWRVPYCFLFHQSPTCECLCVCNFYLLFSLCGSVSVCAAPVCDVEITFSMLIGCCRRGTYWVHVSRPELLTET